jgi:hypothetical protein
VRVFNGVTLAEVYSFFAYGELFTGGVYVAAADINFDGFDDIILGPGAGGSPHVRVLYGHDLSDMHNFHAYDVSFTGGVTVAAGRIDLDVFPEIITGAGPGGGPEVRIFNGRNVVLMASFHAYDPSFTGGVFVAAGDMTFDGSADIITGAGPGGEPLVRMFDGGTFRHPPHLQRVLIGHNFLAYPAGFSGGVRVGTSDLNGDGRADIITGAGPGGGPHVRVLDGLSLNDLESFFAFEEHFSGGVFVAG